MTGRDTIEIDLPPGAGDAALRGVVHRAYGGFRRGVPVRVRAADDGEAGRVQAALTKAGVPSVRLDRGEPGRDAVGVVVTDQPPKPAPRAELVATSAPARVAILGLGVVGTGVYELLEETDGIEVVAVSVRDPGKPRDVDVPAEIVTDDVCAVAAGRAGTPADLVIELIGGTTLAREAALATLRRGADLVTANKALLAEHWDELHDAAEASGARVAFSASVGGSVPVLERIAARPGGRVRTVRAILNGTTNFILDRLAAGDGFDAAVAEAQRLGFAEADPSRDLAGLDAADKLRVIARVAGGVSLRETDIAREPLRADAAGPAAEAGRAGHALRHVCELDFGDGADAIPAASVRLDRLGPSDPLHAVAGERNAAEIIWASGETELVTGWGAGRYPTAESVVADVLDTIAARARNQKGAADA